MVFDGVVLKQPDNGFVARPIFWPDAIAHGATPQEAIDVLRVLIRDLLTQIQFVKVEVDLPDSSQQNPWLAKAGMFVDYPTWDDFIYHMSEYRKQVDAQE